MALAPFIDPQIVDWGGSGRGKDRLHHHVGGAPLGQAKDPLCCG